MKSNFKQRPYIFLISLCILIFSLLSNAEKTTSPLISITPLEATKLIEENSAILVDVRELDEISSGMAKPARWMPLSRMNDGDRLYSDFLSTLPKDKSIILYCAAGRRAQRAQSKLESHGYRTYNMGGFSNWLNAKLPTRKPEKY